MKNRIISVMLAFVFLFAAIAPATMSAAQGEQFKAAAALSVSAAGASGDIEEIIIDETVLNGSTMSFESNTKTIINAEFNNTDVIYNYGEISINAGFNNTGVIYNYGKISISLNAELYNAGTVYNCGNMHVEDGSYRNEDGAVTYNYGSLQITDNLRNNGEIYNACEIQNSGGMHNAGEIYNSNLIDGVGTITHSGNGRIYNSTRARGVIGENLVLDRSYVTVVETINTGLFKEVTVSLPAEEADNIAKLTFTGRTGVIIAKSAEKGIFDDGTFVFGFPAGSMLSRVNVGERVYINKTGGPHFVYGWDAQVFEMTQAQGAEIAFTGGAYAQPVHPSAKAYEGETVVLFGCSVAGAVYYNAQGACVDVELNSDESRGVKYFTMPGFDVVLMNETQAAKNRIERHDWTVLQSDRNTQTAIKSWLEAQLGTMNLYGAEYEIDITDFEAAKTVATDYTGNADGTFEFTVSLSTGSAEQGDLVTAEATVTSGVIRAVPVYTVPTDLKASCADTLSSVRFPVFAGGSFSWDSSYAANTMVGAAGTQTFKAVFTPADVENYTTITDIDVKIKVSKANPFFTLPGAGELYIEEKTNLTLADVALPQGWEWTQPDSAVISGNRYNALFTPDNTDIYNTAERAIKVTVTECTHSNWSEWESDDNATFLHDCTVSRVCLRCGERETVAEEGTAGLNEYPLLSPVLLRMVQILDKIMLLSEVIRNMVDTF